MLVCKSNNYHFAIGQQRDLVCGVDYVRLVGISAPAVAHMTLENRLGDVLRFMRKMMMSTDEVEFTVNVVDVVLLFIPLDT